MLAGLLLWTSFSFVMDSCLHSIFSQKNAVPSNRHGSSPTSAVVKSISSVEGGDSKTTEWCGSEGVMALEIFTPRQWGSVRLQPHLISQKLLTAGFFSPTKHKRFRSIPQAQSRMTTNFRQKLSPWRLWQRFWHYYMY